MIITHVQPLQAMAFDGPRSSDVSLLAAVATSPSPTSTHYGQAGLKCEGGQSMGCDPSRGEQLQGQLQGEVAAVATPPTVKTEEKRSEEKKQEKFFSAYHGVTWWV